METENSKEKKSFKKRFEDNFALGILSILLIGFLAGLGCYKTIIEIAQLETLSKNEISELKNKAEQYEVCKSENDSLKKHRQQLNSLETGNKEVKQAFYTKVSKGDTSIISTNHPSNINIGGKQNIINENKGVIGDNNQFFITSENQRHLGDTEKNTLIQLITRILEKKNKPKDFLIVISSATGNNEAYTLSKEILDFLASKKYNVENNIGQFNKVPPIQGVVVDYEKTNTKQEYISIRVGYK